MKKLLYIITLFLLLSVPPGLPQDFSNDKKLTRKEKKEALQRELRMNYRAIDTLLQKKTFVLEADYLQGRYGDQVPVTSHINFIRVNSPQVILQTGTYVSPGGYNGLGGVTAEGTINNYRINSDDKKLSHTVYFSTTTQVGTYDVILRISADGSATATITGMTRGSLTYRGSLVAPYNSRVFKGMNSI